MENETKSRARFAVVAQPETDCPRPPPGIRSGFLSIYQSISFFVQPFCCEKKDWGRPASSKTWFGEVAWSKDDVIVRHDWQEVEDVARVDDVVLTVGSTHLFVVVVTKSSVYVFREDDVSRCWYSRLTEKAEDLRFQSHQWEYIRRDWKKEDDQEALKDPKTSSSDVRLLCTDERVLFVDNRRPPGPASDPKTSRLALIHDDSIYRRGAFPFVPIVVPFPYPVEVAKADSGRDFFVLLDVTGAVFAFGTGTRGELGVGMVRRVDEPVLVEALDGIRIVDIACGGWHTLALTESGDVYVWGWNHQGQLGEDKNPTELFPTPVDIGVLLAAGDVEEGVVGISADGNSSTLDVSTRSSIVGASPHRDAEADDIVLRRFVLGNNNSNQSQLYAQLDKS
ncbi:unnamed protein product [Caenorhabditis auriculariae]|uniref:Uncharacterized protein n=1 Tax=Caenorhabditis auriculariae TaxID=2777116 RepID=A0A8S1GMV0_9PELO|nr:unnamed protein product [Caenorhabditis auriculariae]